MIVLVLHLAANLIMLIFTHHLILLWKSVKIPSLFLTSRLVSLPIIILAQGFIINPSTDSHSYLLYSSFHPKDTLNSIPFSQLLRLNNNHNNYSSCISQASMRLHIKQQSNSEIHAPDPANRAPGRDPTIVGYSASPAKRPSTGIRAKLQKWAAVLYRTINKIT